MGKNLKERKIIKAMALNEIEEEYKRIYRMYILSGCPFYQEIDFKENDSKTYHAILEESEPYRIMKWSVDIMYEMCERLENKKAVR